MAMRHMNDRCTLSLFHHHQTYIFVSAFEPPPQSQTVPGAPLQRSASHDRTRPEHAQQDSDCGCHGVHSGAGASVARGRGLVGEEAGSNRDHRQYPFAFVIANE